MVLKHKNWKSENMPIWGRFSDFFAHMAQIMGRGDRFVFLFCNFVISFPTAKSFLQCIFTPKAIYIYITPDHRSRYKITLYLNSIRFHFYLVLLNRIIHWKIPVINGDELEEILALPLASHVDHHGARGHAVGRQARHECLQGLQLGGAGQHYGFKCLKNAGWFNKCLFQTE